MRKHLMIALVLSLGAMVAVDEAQAADLSKQDPIEVVIDLGTKDGDLVFTPNRLNFDTGKLYKLVLKNPSRFKHYFSALRFASAVWTRKVEIGGAEVKGAVREIELKPDGEAEWFFVPVQAGTFRLECTIRGHAEAGMVGEVTVR